MGQSSIAMLNKVGYSMFWNSMWDNKISYSRNLKEDVFLNEFFSLIFNDNVSANFTFSKKIDKSAVKRYSINVDEKNNSLYKYVKRTNKMKVSSSKLWILKYQKWIIIYKFVYIIDFSFDPVKNKYEYGDDFSYIYKFYKKSCKSVNFKYSMYKQYFKNNSF